MIFMATANADTGADRPGIGRIEAMAQGFQAAIAIRISRASALVHCCSRGTAGVTSNSSRMNFAVPVEGTEKSESHEWPLPSTKKASHVDAQVDGSAMK